MNEKIPPFLEEILDLAHFGVKGMKWGVRRANPSATVDVVSDATGHRTPIRYDPTKAKVETGPDGKLSISTYSKKELRKIQSQVDRVPSDDAVAAAIARQKVNRGGTKVLSNKELQELVTRMNLETQFASLKDKEPTKISNGQSTVKKILGVAATMQQVHALATGPLGKAIAKRLTKK